jgi:hypothetical protein
MLLITRMKNFALFSDTPIDTPLGKQTARGNHIARIAIQDNTAPSKIFASEHDEKKPGPTIRGPGSFTVGSAAIERVRHR